jgi:Nif-specific regulatory protein
MVASEQVIGNERDLYRCLLELRYCDGPKQMLEHILKLVVEATDAERGYLELFGTGDRTRPQWTITHRCSNSEAAEISVVTSRGIVSAALAAGTTLQVPYAALDDRFAQLPSVRDQRLEAVLCIPIGGEIGIGVLYLEGRRGAGPFSSVLVKIAEIVARHLWPNVDRLRAPARLLASDPTQGFRERLKLDGVLGRSQALARVFELIAPFAPLDVTILITGDSGTGKTQIARAIHDNSPRRNGPFVEINCAAIPEGLIESELFGMMAGAFPGARRTAGKVDSAEGGTLFLDEIVEIPLQAQGKLLQLLQSRQYYALASTKLNNANVRVLAATNTDLAAMVAARRFREDLFYRINVVNIKMPNLRERGEDVPVLVDELLARIAHEHRIIPIPVSDQFRTAMELREWPGNVRQLKHTVESALIRANAEGAPQIEVRHLPDAPTAPDQAMTFHEATRTYQRELLRRELTAKEWNVAAVAARLDLTRSHIYNLMNQFKLKKE